MSEPIIKGNSEESSAGKVNSANKKAVSIAHGNLSFAAVYSIHLCDSPCNMFLALLDSPEVESIFW